MPSGHPRGTAFDGGFWDRMCESRHPMILSVRAFMAKEFMGIDLGTATVGRAVGVNLKALDAPATAVAPVAALPRETERAFQKRVIGLARSCGFKVAHFRPARVMRNGKWKYETPIDADGKGFPDLVMTRPGRVIVAELKAKGGKATPEQSVWLDCFRAAGVPAYLWTPDSWADIERVLRAAK